MKLNHKTVAKFKKEIGKAKVFNDDEMCYAYAYDATGVHHLPDLVVFPECESDVQKILKLSNQFKIPVTPRGAGVGYSGGSIPLKGGIALVFTKMKRILNIDPENMSAEVEPGVTTIEFQERCRKAGLFYPPDPASLKTSTIGGNVAENAGGPRCFKYGVTGNYVLGLEGFLVNGEKIHAGSAIIKDVAGYNLKSLLIGSEGTLAVVTKIILRLIPLPETNRIFRIDFDSLRAGAAFINSVIHSGIAPSVLEFMDRTALDASLDYLGFDPDTRVNASVIIELDGTAIDVGRREEMLEGIIDVEQIISFFKATDESKTEEIWKLRRNISPAIARLRPKKINEDIVVPVKQIPEAVETIKSIGTELNLLIVLFGHFGDGNIHTNLMVDPDDADEMSRAEIALDRIFKYVIEIGGSISGEHGIGISKKPFMKIQFSDTEIALFKGIKQVFDPENRLNPGKMF